MRRLWLNPHLVVLIMLALAATACSIEPDNVGLAVSSNDDFRSAATDSPGPAEPTESSAEPSGASEPGPSTGAQDEPSQGLQPDDGEGERETPTAQPEASAVGFAWWNGPAADPIQLGKRVQQYASGGIATFGQRLTTMQPAPGSCRDMLPQPASVARHVERHTHNPGVDYMLFVHLDAASAAAYAADLPAAVADCSDGGSASATVFEQVDPADSGVVDERFSAWDAWNGETGLRAFATHHGAFSVVVTLELRPVEGPREFLQLGAMLGDVATALDSTTPVLPDTDLWANAVEFEDYLLDNFRHTGLTFDAEQLACVVSEVERAKETRGELPSLGVRDRIGVWCAAEAFSAEQMQSSLRIPWYVGNVIADPERRSCFYETVRRFDTRGTFEEYMVRVGDRGIDPNSAERVALDAMLLADCDVTEAEAIMAGLPTRGPLDTSSDREPFCTAFARRQEPRPDSALSESDAELFTNSEMLAMESAIVAPPSLAEAWSRRLRRYEGLIELIETTGAAGVSLYPLPGYIALDAEVNFEATRVEVDEYRRINC